jgi:snapalysin
LSGKVRLLGNCPLPEVVMIRARVVGGVLGAAVFVGALVAGSGGVASAAPAGAAASPASVITLTYDASRASSWSAAITQGVANWNAAVHNVKLVPASSFSSADFVYVATNGWPQTTLGPIFPGDRGEVQLGQEAVTEGYDKTRIAAHETGHIFGLLDHYSGPCSELMSGHGPGTSCKNAKPDAAEAAQVDANYANGAAARPQRRVVVVDAWSAQPELAGAGTR